MPDTTIEITSSPFTGPALGDTDNWYLHLRAGDYAGNWAASAIHLGPFWIDSHAPSLPTSVSPGCTAANNAWQNDCPDANFTWMGASDGLGSGIHHYNVYFGSDPDGVAYPVISSPAYNPPAVPANGVYYLRLRALDAANNASVWSTLFTLRYDSGLPTNPTSVSSSHSPSAWSNLNCILMSWSGAADALSGIAGYDTTWSTSPTPPPEPWEETSGTSLGSPALEDGISWYFYLRAFDAAGNRAGSALSYGPYWIDATAPATTLSLQQSGDRINLSWSTVEALSGLVSHDLEYRLGSDGEWTGWLVGTTQTSAVFGPPRAAGAAAGPGSLFPPARARPGGQSRGIYGRWRWMAGVPGVYLPAGAA